MRVRALRVAGLLGIWSWLGLGLATATATAQTAYLVKDLATGEAGNAASDPVAMLPAGKNLFFVDEPTEEDQETALELWVTDGTAAGTQQLPCSSQGGCGRRFLTAIGDLAFYVQGAELWRSDGTRSGTFLLTGGLVSDPFHHSSTAFAVLGGLLYFITYDLSSRDPSEQLWRSDGTAAGTFLVADVGPGLYYGDQDVLVAVGRRLFFLAPELAPSNSSADLWTSDGTAQATGPVTGFKQEGVSLLTAVGRRLFFVAAQGDPPSEQLWVSDGTKTGTRLLSAVTSTGWMMAAGEKLVFEAHDALQQPQLWVSDGTTAGTRQVTSGSGFGPLADPRQVAAAGSTLVFVGGEDLWAAALGSTGRPVSLCGAGGCGFLDQVSLYALGGRVAFLNDGLWASDGTPGGTIRLKRRCSSFCTSGAIQLQGGEILFSVAESDGESFELWSSDGTRAGTRRFANQLLGGLDPLAAQVGNDVFFVGSDGELRVSDGTVAGTRQLTDATDPRSSWPAKLTAVGGQLFFETSTTTDSAQVWHSAGTAESTLRVPVSAAPGSGPPVAAFGGVVFVGTAGSSSFPLQLWRSDGTAAGTLPLTTFSPPLSASAVAPPVAAGGEVYFVATLETGGGSIWKSDGTSAGTVEVVELPAATPPVMSLGVFGKDFYMMTGPPGTVTAVWKSDGTPGGTLQLTSVPFGFNPLLPGPAPGFVALGGLVYFTGGVATTSLWQTDGTPAGTAAVQVGGTSFGSPTDILVRDGSLYLFTGQASFGIRELWRTDGTAAGTELLGTFSGGPVLLTSGLTPFGDGLAFSADDGVHGSELWVTDGTAAGTRLVSDIQPGSVGSSPSGLAAAGGRLFFAADDGVHGNELWESDGTAAGTRMVQDINPGPAPSSPSGMTAAGGLLYFAADDGLTGRELWALPLGGPGGCQAAATALCLAGGRFKVEAFWRDFQGNSGAGQAQALSGDTGSFWFFSPDDLEVVVKVLDGRALDGHFWVFYGALSSVEYSLTVTDTATGLTRRYLNPLGELASVGDTTAFGPMGATSVGVPSSAGRPARQAAGTAAATAAAGGSCQPGPLRLCLNGSRFAVEASWTDFSGHSGDGAAVPLTGETGYFWFFAAGNVETVLKVIDGRGLNGHFWVFYGALSNVQYTLTVTDTATGAKNTYTNPAGQFASVADTSAF